MAESRLLEDFKNQTNDQLLRALLDTQELLVESSQEQKVLVVADKLNAILRNRLNEDSSS